jgi:copper chaperone CopZ
MKANTNDSTSRTLKIDGMSGDHCVQKVKGALEGVNGVETESVGVGTATIDADKAGCDAACQAIDRAGFQAREQGRNDTRNQAGNDSRNQAGNDSRNQAGNDSRNQAGNDAGKHSGARPATSEGRDRQPQKADRTHSPRA